MTPTWWTPERLARLRAAVEVWRGTPFSPNSCSAGRGVSCQKLAGALYEAAGYPPVDVPDVPIAHARFSTTSFVVAFFTARQDFAPVPRDEVQAGDVLGFRINKCVHHLGVALGDGLFFHAIDGIGATVASLEDATWSSRLAHVWRPKP